VVTPQSLAADAYPARAREAAGEALLSPLKHEPSVDLSINGQQRYLDLSATMAQTVNLIVGEKDKLSRKSDGAIDSAPSDLKAIVGPEKEVQFRHAFNLVNQYEQRVNKEVLKPGLDKFTTALDNAERAMPKAKLGSLEKERAAYGGSIAAQEIAIAAQDKGGLVYFPPPERGKEMRAFDLTATNLKDQAGKAMIQGIDKVGKSYGAKLEHAGALVEEYYLLKEEKQPKAVVQLPTLQA